MKLGLSLACWLPDESENVAPPYFPQSLVSYSQDFFELRFICISSNKFACVQMTGQT